MTEERRIGVYICHCGGNISDYVDVAAVRDALKDEPGVVISETTMFACSDGTQHDMINDIKEQGLDGLVVASCSPKLHQITFRGVSKRADLNPYAYSQVNIREQDSWAHGDDPEGATAKAISSAAGGTTMMAVRILRNMGFTCPGQVTARKASRNADPGPRINGAKRQLSYS